MVTDFDDCVASHADATLDSFPKALFGSASEQRNTVLELRAELTARVSHWKAEARRYARLCLKLDTPAPADLVERPRIPMKWEDIKIEFLSDHRVQVVANAKRRPVLNYAEMGFEDRRSKASNQAWLTLRLLAERKGRLETAPDWPRIEKRIEEIRAALRKFFVDEGFDIPKDSDPIPFSKDAGGGYRTTFIVGTSRSYET